MIASRDGIFKHPNQLVKLANKIDYSNVGYTRGVRSKPLHEIDNELFQSINMKILNCFYQDSKIEFFARTYFQKNDYDINDGWVHQDNCMFTGIVYLNPDNTSGTSLYNIKDSMFYKTTSFTGEYNRLVAFDGQMFHSSEVQEKDKGRLILISFIEKIKVVSD